MIDPASEPVDLGLDGRKPWIPQDYLVISQVCEEEPHFCVVLACLDLRIGVEF
jgi:hypothetical protein